MSATELVFMCIGSLVALVGGCLIGPALPDREWPPIAAGVVIILIGVGISVMGNYA